MRPVRAVRCSTVEAVKQAFTNVTFRITDSVAERLVAEVGGRTGRPWVLSVVVVVVVYIIVCRRSQEVVVEIMFASEAGEASSTVAHEVIADDLTATAIVTVVRSTNMNRRLAVMTEVTGRAVVNLVLTSRSSITYR